jgi:transcription antitermination factor NusG
MPLRSLENELFPPDLLDADRSRSPGEAQWAAVYCKPRTEKQLARVLLGRGLGYYLPLYTREWRKNGRCFQSQLPLFPGYVFINCLPAQQLSVYETKLVVHWIKVEDQNQFVTELAGIHRLLSSGAPVMPEDRLAPGSPVRICAGPFEGLVGRVVRKGRKLRFSIAVEFMKRGVSIEVEPWMLEPADSAKAAC